MKAERGSAVIMAMLVVAVATTLVAGALWQQSALIRETENERALSQARWLLRGAIDWAGVILQEDARTSSVDHRGEPWAVTLNDLFTSLPHDAGKASDKEALARVLMGYARANPHRIRGRLMPVIVYDPQAGRQAFSVTLRKIKEPG